MKSLHPIEQIALTLSLALVCAMATTRCTHAHVADSLLLTQSTVTAYPARAGTHCQSDLIVSNTIGTHAALNAASLCVQSSSTSMVRLDGAYLYALVANSFQSINLSSLATSFDRERKTSIQTIGVNHD